MTKPIIAVDLDDTLAASIEGTLAHVSSVLGVQMTRGNIADVAYWAKYGVDDTEAIRLVQDYNKLGFPGLKPLEGAAEAVQRLNRHFRVCVVTARDPAVEAPTRKWIDKFFPGAFERIIFVGNPYISKVTKPKEKVCQELEARWLIDDNRTHAYAAAQQGIDSILFGGHAWHVDVEPREHLYLAADWHIVEGIING